MCTPSTPNAIILCGGAGVRLRSVTSTTPKSMASIGGRPFLELLLKQLKRNGFKRVILAVGYKGEVIQEYFGERALGLDLAYSLEYSPLGTGGALRNAAPLVMSDVVLAMNGDSYTDANLRQCVTGHRASGAEAAVVVVPVDGRQDCGTVDVNLSGRIVGFLEKPENSKTNYINAGIYILPRTTLWRIPEGQVSLERDLLPRWIREGCHIRATICPSTCIDIGTPERYWRAQELLAGMELQGSRLEQEEL